MSSAVADLGLERAPGALCGLRCDLLKLPFRDSMIAEALEAAEPGELLDSCGSVA